jgi:hypothetical protein
MTTVADALEGARTAYGLSLLTRPGAMTKVLGARLVVQGGATLWTDDELAHDGGGLVDALHALSMVGLAAVSRTRRREALHAALAATGFATAEALVWLLSP